MSRIGKALGVGVITYFVVYGVIVCLVIEIIGTEHLCR